MKQRLRLFRRGQFFYFEDTSTGKQISLGTKDRREASRLMELKLQSMANPSFNQLLLKAVLTSQDGEFSTRTWQSVMDQMLTHGKAQTQKRCKTAFKQSAFEKLKSKKLIETTSQDLLGVLATPKVSVNHYLRRLHNLALGLGWIAFPILPPKLWPKPQFGDKRAITSAEYKAILAAEPNAERNLYYQFLWETGAAQTDAACLRAEQIDWKTRTLAFQRMKTGSWCYLTIGKTLEAILKQLSTEGPLFPKISQQSANDRAAEFYRRCKLLKIEGISLHSFRYAWAERAKTVGFPERFAQEALGHNSKAVHRAYAKGAQVRIPSLEDF